MHVNLDLFDAPASFEPRKLARRENPATSKAAATRVAEFGNDHHTLIVAALREHGRAKGLTVHEIAVYTRLDAHAIGKRMNELQADKVARVRVDADGAEVTRPSPSGRQARVWELA